jgi:hypothetical protein
VSANADNGSCGKSGVALGTPVTGDNCGIASTSNDHPSSTYPVGITSVTWTVADVNGNTATSIQTVTISDNQDPIISGCSNITVGNDAGSCNAVVSWTTPTASDNCSVQSLNGDHTSGGTFAVGQTTVTYTATDIHGNTSTCSFVVTVNDTEDPQISNCPSDIELCGAGTAIWTSPSAADNCGMQSFTGNHSSGESFPVGTTAVVYTATDIHGNTSTCSFNVIVTAPPTVSAGSDQVICYTGTSNVSATIGGGASSVTWLTSGDGSL